MLILNHFLQVQEPFLNDAIQCLSNLFNIYDEYEEKIVSATREEDQSLIQNFKSSKENFILAGSEDYQGV